MSATHVAISSAVLFAALAVSFAPRLTSRTRFAIVAAGVAKFALPASLFAVFIPRRPAVLVSLTGGSAGALAPLPQTQSFDGMRVAAMIWAGVALLLAVRIAIDAYRAASAARRFATAPAPRERAALDSARRRIGVIRAVALVRSQLAEAPAVTGVLRPLIVLPAGGCDALDDEELDAILAHECAHIARHDNLVAFLEALVRAAFWWNPLLWIAARRLAELREKACDERVADDAVRTDVYAAALAKVCNLIVSRPVPGLSCMASNHVKERVLSIMRYETLRSSALPHRLMVAVAAAVLIFSTAANAALNAPVQASSPNRYLFTPKVVRSGDAFVVETKVVDMRTSEVIAQLRVNNQTPGRITFENTVISVEANLDQTGRGTSRMIVTENGAIVEDSSYSVNVANEPAVKFTGEPISLTLTNASLRDILGMFGQISGLEMVIAPEIEGKVTMKIENVPWDEALDRVITEHGLRYRIEGKKLYVTK